MNGLIALLGSGEYLPVMNETDSYLLKQTVADGRTPRVVCFPTAAGMEGDESVGRWKSMGEEHFRALGADVTGRFDLLLRREPVVPVQDHAGQPGLEGRTRRY